MGEIRGEDDDGCRKTGGRGTYNERGVKYSRDFFSFHCQHVLPFMSRNGRRVGIL
jgi:hypothetical protein